MMARFMRLVGRLVIGHPGMVTGVSSSLRSFSTQTFTTFAPGPI